MAEPLYPLLSLSRLRMGTDGTGVTTLIAGAGCPLRCPYCINRRLLAEAKAESVTPQELVARVRIDNLYFQATGGGVTFGGGESLLHAAFIRRFRELCPAAWRVSVETSLAVPRQQVALAAEAADAFIVDCKDMHPDIYRRYTGGEESLMEGNLRFLLDAVGAERVLVRVPGIPGYNSREEQAESVEKLRALGVENLDVFDYIVREER